MKRASFICWLALLAIPTLAWGQVPQIISYQGKLTTAAGANVPDGNYSLTFRIYDVATGGAALWTETQTAAVAGGLFSATLGSVTPIGLSFDKSCWLGVTVAGSSELAPRTQLTSAAYSLGLRVPVLLRDSSVSVSLGVFNYGDGTGLYGWSRQGVGTQAYSLSGVGLAAGSNDSAAAEAISVNGLGLYARSTNANGIEAYSTNGMAAIVAEGENNYGLVARSYSATADAVAAINWTTGTNGGLAGSSAGVRGQGTVAGVQGTSQNGIGVSGVSTYGDGLRGEASAANKSGIFAINTNPSGYAGFFTGRLHVNGTLSKLAGSFKIDHPLDPENKYLQHSFVESPDMMNVYNGNVTLDAAGQATVTLPDYFEALNKEFRYQLTPIGAPAPNLFIAQEVMGNQFRIEGGTPGMKVSWQVTGIRHDAYADAHRIQVETEKQGVDRGKFLAPKELGQPETAGIDYEQSHTPKPEADTSPTRRQ